MTSSRTLRSEKTHLSLEETKRCQITGHGDWDRFIEIGAGANNGDSYDFCHSVVLISVLRKDVIEETIREQR